MQTAFMRVSLFPTPIAGGVGRVVYDAWIDVVTMTLTRQSSMYLSLLTVIVDVLVTNSSFDRWQRDVPELIRAASNLC